MQATQRDDNEPQVENIDLDTLKNILEGALLAAARPLSLDQMQALFGGEGAPEKVTLRQALKKLEEDCAERAVELVEVASGFRLQVRQEFQPWVSKLFEEKPQRYSRALLETLALIAYRQPITRGEIEEVRGVSVSTSIIRTLEEREWIRIVGYRDVPGKPALYGTTKAFLDYFGLKSLDDLPSLAAIRDIGDMAPELDFSGGEGSRGSAREDATAVDAGGTSPAEEEAEQADDTGRPAPAEASGEGEADDEIGAEDEPVTPRAARDEQSAEGEPSEEGNGSDDSTGESHGDRVVVR